MRAIVSPRVIAAAVRIILDLKPQIEIATIIAIKNVKATKNGRAYLLKRSVQQPMTMDTASRATETTIIVAMLINVCLNH